MPLGSVARNIAVVGGATAIGQAAAIVAAPLLGRLYDPHAFGLLSVYTAVLSILVAVSSLRFDFAVPIATDVSEAAHLVAVSLLLGAVMSVGVAVIIVLWGPQLSAAVGAAALSTFLWLLPIALFVGSVAQSMSSWALHARAFPALGRVRAMQGIGQAGSQVLLGLLHAGPLGLLLGDLVGRGAGSERLLGSWLTTVRSMKLTIDGMRRHAHEHWGFAQVMTAASLLNAVSLQVPFLLIPALFDLEASGQFFLAYRVLVLPAALVAAAGSQVFFGEASFRRSDHQKLHDLAHNAAVSLLVFSIPTYSIVAVAGPALIEAVFGPQWQVAGLYAQILAPSLILWAVASPISTLLLVGRRERESLAFTVAELSLKAGSLAAGAALGSLTLGIVILSVVSVLLNIASLWRFLRVAHVRLRELIRPSARIGLLTIPSLVLVLVAGRFAPTSTVVAAAIAWVAAFALAARFSPEPRALLSGVHD